MTEEKMETFYVRRSPDGAATVADGGLVSKESGEGATDTRSWPILYSSNVARDARTFAQAYNDHRRGMSGASKEGAVQGVRRVGRPEHERERIAAWQRKRSDADGQDARTMMMLAGSVRNAYQELAEARMALAFESMLIDESKDNWATPGMSRFDAMRERAAGAEKAVENAVQFFSGFLRACEVARYGARVAEREWLPTPEPGA